MTPQTKPQPATAARVQRLIHDAERQFSTGDIPTAHQRFVMALKLDPSRTRAWNGLGVCFHQLGRIQEAISSFQNALQINPGDVLARENLHHICWDSDHRSNSILHARALINLGRDVDRMEMRLEQVHLKPSDRQAALILETGEPSLDIVSNYLEDMGVIVHRIGKFELRAFSENNSLKDSVVLANVVDSIQPSFLVVNSTDPALSLIDEIGHQRQIPGIVFGAASLKGAWREFNDKEDLKSQTDALLASLATPAAEKSSLPLISIQLEWDQELNLIQFLVDRICTQTLPFPLLEFFVVTPLPDLLKKNLEGVHVPFPIHFVSTAEAVSDLAKGEWLLETHLQDLEDRRALSRIVKEQINAPRVHFPKDNLVPRSSAKVCTLIRGWDNTHKTERCIRGLREHHNKDELRIVYVDNGSKLEDYIELLRKFPDVEFVRFPENMGSCRGINAGMMMAAMEDHEFIILMDNDADPPLHDKMWLERWIDYFKDPTVGGAGATTYYVGGAQNIERCPETYMKNFNRKNGSGGAKGSIYVPALVSFAVMFRKEALESIGWLSDEQYEPGNTEDTDLCLRMVELGWKMVVAKSVWINHEGSQTFERENVLQTLINKNRTKLSDKMGLPRMKRLGFEFETRPFLERL